MPFGSRRPRGRVLNRRGRGVVGMAMLIVALGFWLSALLRGAA